MTEYVLGFRFNENLDEVVLIEKQKPKWQKGLLNGVGGKIEPKEQPIESMVREFKEETSLKTSIKEWVKYSTLVESGVWVVYVYYSIGSIKNIKSMTNEKVSIIPLGDLSYMKKLSNLTWLIPMAIDFICNSTLIYSSISYLTEGKAYERKIH